VGYDALDIGEDDADVDGTSYGVNLGYDFGVGANLALGIDAEISDTSAKMKSGPQDVGLVLGRDLYVGARVTTALSDSFNLYGKVGYVNTRVQETAVLPNDEVITVSDEADGFRAGVGGQFAIASNTYVGLEYRYSNYEGDAARHQVAATLGFRF